MAAVGMPLLAMLITILCIMLTHAWSTRAGPRSAGDLEISSDGSLHERDIGSRFHTEHNVGSSAADDVGDGTVRGEVLGSKAAARLGTRFHSEHAVNSSVVDNVSTLEDSYVRSYEVHPDLAGQVTEKLLEVGNIPVGKSCEYNTGSALGIKYMGCDLGEGKSCTCGWGQRCYPKFVYMDEEIFKLSGDTVPSNPDVEKQPSDKYKALHLSVGMCQSSMSVLIAVSIFLFTLFLTFTVALRTYLRLREGEDMPLDVGIVKATMVSSPLPMRGPALGFEHRNLLETRLSQNLIQDSPEVRSAREQSLSAPVASDASSAVLDVQ